MWIYTYHNYFKNTLQNNFEDLLNSNKFRNMNIPLSRLELPQVKSLADVFEEKLQPLNEGIGKLVNQEKEKLFLSRRKLSAFSYSLGKWLNSGKKVFFLLGAGCSYYNGIPLMQNFLDDAPTLFSEDWKSTAGFIRKVRQASNIIHLNFDNIEELLTLLELYELFEKDEAAKTKDAVQDLIKKIIGEKQNKDKLKVYPSYWLKLSQRSVYESQGQIGGFSSLTHWLLSQLRVFFANQLSVATFNYDDLLPNFPRFRNEKAGIFLLEKDLVILDRADNQKVFPETLHLHGSINTQIVPPSMSKKFSNPDVASVWIRAKALLEEADYLVVCGYSMPISDYFFSHFIALSSMNREKPLNIIVINPDSEEVVVRFKDKLSKGVIETNRLQFITGREGKFENLFLDLQNLDIDENGFPSVHSNSPFVPEFTKTFSMNSLRLEEAFNRT